MAPHVHHQSDLLDDLPDTQLKLEGLVAVNRRIELCTVRETVGMTFTNSIIKLAFDSLPVSEGPSIMHRQDIPSFGDSLARLWL